MRKHIGWLYVLSAISVILVAGYAFREPLLRQCSKVLIQEDVLKNADAIIVLSGGGYDRGNEAVKLFNEGLGPVMICTGANPVYDLRSFGVDTLECYGSSANLLRLGVPDSCIRVIAAGTSTFEEADTLRHYLEANKYRTVILVTSKLHTGRVKRVFTHKFQGAAITFFVHGAASSRYDELNWWKNEDGLIALNNEWLKTIYYFLKY